MNEPWNNTEEIGEEISIKFEAKFNLDWFKIKIGVPEMAYGLAHVDARRRRMGVESLKSNRIVFKKTKNKMNFVFPFLWEEKDIWQNTNKTARY